MFARATDCQRAACTLCLYCGIRRILVLGQRLLESAGDRVAGLWQSCGDVEASVVMVEIVARANERRK